MFEKVKCKLGIHKEGNWQPAVGGRNVKRCVYCDTVTEEQSIINQVILPKAPRPQGKETDKWFNR